MANRAKRKVRETFEADIFANGWSMVTFTVPEREVKLLSDGFKPMHRVRVTVELLKRKEGKRP